MRPAQHSLRAARRPLSTPLVALAVLLSAVAAAAPAAAQGRPLPTETWSGRILFPPELEPGLTAQWLNLRVFAASTDEEIVALLAELRGGGMMALQSAMRRLPAKGFIVAGKLAGAEVTVIRVADLPEGRRRVRVFCDFPMRLFDDSVARDTRDYPFAFVELLLEADGSGSGVLVPAASLREVDGELRIENAETPPLQVVEVTLATPGGAPENR